MKAIVIGGTGHIGTYLVPRLVEANHDVTVVSRGTRDPYVAHPAWRLVKRVELDRTKLEAEGRFGSRIADLGPDIVVDLISFTEASTRQLVDALRGRVSHFLHCGSIWVKGFVVEAPTREETVSPPFGEYGVNKKAIEDYLLGEARRSGFPATMVNPGHIVGPGHAPVNPMACKSAEVFSRLAQGESLLLPHVGLDPLHHVHADDVAQVFECAIERWSASVGEQFFAVSPAAVTLRGFAEAAARWFGREANLEYACFDEWKKRCGLPDDEIAMAEAHITHGQCCSTAKARALLGYEPRYTSLEAVREAVEWMGGRGLVRAG